jgi:hypothetical protein
MPVSQRMLPPSEVELELPAVPRRPLHEVVEPVEALGYGQPTKEAVGGLDILECRSLDEAIEIAAGQPAAQIGTIEVRPAVGEVGSSP